MYIIYNHIFKRIFLEMIMFLLFFNISGAQNIELNNPMSDPIFINPAFAGVNSCNYLNLNIKKKFIYETATLSYTGNIPNKSASAAIAISSFLQGKSINTFSAGALFSKQIKLNSINILSFAFETFYKQQNIIPDNLIYRHMINPLTGNISSSSYSYIYEPKNIVDFSAGFLLLTPKLRTGISILNIRELHITEYEDIDGFQFNFHIGKSIKLKQNVRNSVKKIIIPELFIQYSANNLRFSYGVSLYTNNLIADFYLKHNYTIQTINPTFGIQFSYNSYIFGYSYEITLNRYITVPIHSNQIKLAYKFKCIKKRNKKNTIFCTSF